MKGCSESIIQIIMAGFGKFDPSMHDKDELEEMNEAEITITAG